MAHGLSIAYDERFPSGTGAQGDLYDVSFTRSLDSFIPFPKLTESKNEGQSDDKEGIGNAAHTKIEEKAVVTEEMKRNYSSETEISDNQLTVTSLSGRPLVGDGASSEKKQSSWKWCCSGTEEEKKAEKQRIKQETAGLRERFKPPDGGFGWFIVFGTFLVQLWVTGLIKSFGIIFLEVMTVFPNSSASLAAWIPAILSFISLILSPVTCALCIRFSCRSVVFAGGICSCAGLTLSYFATSLEHLCLTIGVLVGIGAGLSTTPGIIMTSRYFEKRRALANGICISGTAVGSMLMPPLVEYLTPQYGFKGTILILGACVLHVCIAAVLFRPIEVYQKILENDLKKKKVMDDIVEVQIEEEAEECVQSSVANAVVTSGRFSISLRAEEQKLDYKLPEARFSLDDSDDEETQSSVHDTITPLVNSRLLRSIRNESTPAFRGSFPGTPRGGFNPLTRHASLQRENRHFLQKPGSLKDVSSLSNIDIAPNLPSDTPRLRAGPKRNVSWLQSTTSLMHSVCDLNVDSTCTFKDERAHLPGSEERKKKGFRYYLDFTLLKNTLFILLTSTVMLMAVGCPHFLLYLPAYVTTSVGLTKKESGVLLSVTAACDLVGRLLGGWLADMQFIPRSRMYCCSIVLAALAAVSLPFATDIVGLGILSGIFGFGAGSWYLMVPILLTDYHGIEMIPSSYGLSRLFQGFITLSIPPLIGLIRDLTGTYRVGFFIMGGCMGSAAILMLVVEPFAKRREEKMALAKAESSEEGAPQ